MRRSTRGNRDFQRGKAGRQQTNFDSILLRFSVVPGLPGGLDSLGALGGSIPLFFPRRDFTFQHRAIARPVEIRAGIGFSPRRHVGMARNVADRVARPQRAREGGEPPVLGGSERHVTRAFQFDSNRKIVAARPAVPARFAGVPRAFCAWHKLDQLAVAPDEEVGGHFHARDRGVERMRRRIEAVGKVLEDAGAAERARRQADVVDDEEVDRAGGGPLVAVGRRNEPYAFNQSFVIDAQSLWQSDFGFIPYLG